MTHRLFYDDSYKQETAATVTAVDGPWVTLDQTIFYPEGGGQPGDTGELSSTAGRWPVSDTRKGDADAIRHLLDSTEHGLAVGDAVSLRLNWQRRYRHMRMHTCLHLLGSLIPVPVTGGSVGADKSRLDFDLGEHKLDKEELTGQLNALVTAASELHFESITDAELDANPGLVRTMSVQPPRGSGVIRMVRIEGVDYQPCGGTHIRNTAEIGPVQITKIENKGKRNRRVHLVFAEPVS
jgi:misacylated tRNA(Ala) deacylase